MAALNREFQIQLHGEVFPADGSLAKALPREADQFIAHGVASLPVGWQAIEVYPILPKEYWSPENAPVWAELDLVSAVAQHNVIKNALYQLDGRGAAREKYSQLLNEFVALLAGPEEPCHQFLKSHPELICPTYDSAWSKMRFGNNISDFVFREPYNDYLLVEIEAPHQRLFRKNGHPRQSLVHAVSQINDWLIYIQANKQNVEQELGLLGILLRHGQWL